MFLSAVGLLAAAATLQSCVAFEAIVMHGGSCEVTQYYAPTNWPDYVGKVDLGLTPYYYSAAVSYAGRVFIMGGSKDQDGTVTVADVQVYDQLTNTTSAGTPMPTPRAWHTATLLDGYIYVCGGRNKNVILDTCDVYDPENRTWHALDFKLPQPVDSHGAAVVDDVLYVFGGYTTNGATSDVYQLTYPGWVPSWPLTISRSGFSTTKVDGGNVAICGGYSETGGGLTNTCEVKPFAFPYDLYRTYVFGGYVNANADSSNAIDFYQPTSNSSFTTYVNMTQPCAGFVTFQIGKATPCS